MVIIPLGIYNEISLNHHIKNVPIHNWIALIMFHNTYIYPYPAQAKYNIITTTTYTDISICSSYTAVYSDFEPKPFQ